MRIIRERLTLLLIALLPLHAFLVTVGTKLIAGPDNAPLPWLALWKEGLLGLILLLSLYEVLTSHVSRLKADTLDYLILVLIALGLITSVAMGTPRTNILLGFRYDFIPLIAFLILRRVDWSDTFKEQAMKLLIITGTVIAALGLISFFLPQSVFRTLGYADLHSLYQANGPLAPFQQIGSLGLRRIQSTMSGPNQLGIWLLLPLAALIVEKSKFKIQNSKIIWLLAFGICLLALALTFSRSAWLGAAVMAIALLWMSVPRAAFWRMATAGSLLLVLLGITVTTLAPGIILRATSNEGHIQKPLEAIQLMINHPFGMGLGSAGPASNRASDTCVELPAGADWSWAQPHPALCVFVGGIQVQPPEACTCPVLTENWYLQLGVEMGWMGMLLFLGIVGVILERIQARSGERVAGSSTSQLIANHYLLLALLGISTAALTLHAWEDSAVAYTAWILLAVVLSLANMPSKTILESNKG